MHETIKIQLLFFPLQPETDFVCSSLTLSPIILFYFFPMMLPENMAAKPMTKDEKQVGQNVKHSPEQVMKCPRCDSPNTKFCYYNNYSLSQPRHFCKTCRRYWTKGGALRNVPIGGGCRKGKKVKTVARLGGGADIKGINLPSEIGGFKLLNALSPAMDFHFGGFYNHSPGSSSNSLMGFNCSPPAGIYGSQFGPSIQITNPLNVQTSLVSSIESLSSINQDLHRKLQQRRLSGRIPTISDQKLQPIFFENLDLSEPDQIEKPGNGRKEGDTATEWLFGSSYPPANGGGTAINDPASGNWNGIHAWNNHLSSYGCLP